MCGDSKRADSRLHVPYLDPSLTPLVQGPGITLLKSLYMRWTGDLEVVR